MNQHKVFNFFTKLIPVWFIFWAISSLVKYPYLFSNFLANGIARGAIYAMVALGFGLIYNVTGVLNLAHGEVFMLAGVTSASIFLNILNATSPSLINWGWFFVVFIFCIILGALLSLFTEKIVFKKLRRSNKIAPIIASLGISLIMQNIGIKINGSGRKRFHTIFPEVPGFVSLSHSLERAAVVLAFAIPVLWAFSYLATKSKNGLAIKSVSGSYELSELMGINVNKTIARTFLIAGAAAGAAGIIYAQTYRTTNYSIGMEIGLISYAAAVIGGIGHIRGTILGGFTVGIIEALSDGLPTGLGYRWSETAIYSVFILMLVYRPQGIWGYEEENI